MYSYGTLPDTFTVKFFVPLVPLNPLTPIRCNRPGSIVPVSDKATKKMKGQTGRQTLATL